MICWLTINRICNMRCEWCYAKASGFSANATMTSNTFEHILSVISTQKISRFILLGGEPTLHPSLPDMIRRLKPVKVVLVTNALRLSNRDYVRSLKECGLDVVKISLKGATDQEYKENTGVAGLGRVERAIANLNELSIPYSISVTFSGRVMKALPGIIDLMKRSSATVMSVNYCRPVVLKDSVVVDGMPHPCDMAQETVESYKLIRDSGVACVYNFMLPLCLLPKDFIAELAEKRLLTTICQLQKGNGLIFTPNGNLIPCNHLFEYPFGELGKDFNTAAEFEEFRDSEKVKRFYLRTRNLPDTRCQSCNLKTRCGGGCFIQYLHHQPADIMRQPFTEA